MLDLVHNFLRLRSATLWANEVGALLIVVTVLLQLAEAMQVERVHTCQGKTRVVHVVLYELPLTDVALHRGPDNAMPCNQT